MMKKGAPRLRRDLTLAHALSLVIGSMVGTGIFLFVAPVAAFMLQPWAILGAWLLGAIISACGGLCVAELAATYPETGGVYVYLSKAFGPLVAFLYAWSQFLMIRVGTLAISALAFASFFAVFFNLDPQAASEVQKLLAASLICIFTFINIVGVRLGGQVQCLLTLVKVLCLIGVMGVAVVYTAGKLDPYYVLTPPLRGVAVNSTQPWLLALVSAMMPILWTLGGWDEPTFVAEEVKDPAKNLPLAIIGGLAFVSSLYLGVNAAYLAILSPQEMATSGSRTAILAITRALGPQMGQFMAFFLMVAALGILNGAVMTGARIALAAGYEQILLRWFNHIHPRSQTPQRALVVQGLMAILAIVVLEDIYTLLLYTAVPYWGGAALVALAVIAMRRCEPQRQRPFAVWFYPYPVLIYLFSSLGMVLVTSIANWRHAFCSLVILSLGMLLYFAQALLKQFEEPGL